MTLSKKSPLMGRPRIMKDPQRVSFQIERELYEELRQDSVPVAVRMRQLVTKYLKKQRRKKTQ